MPLRGRNDLTDNCYFFITTTVINFCNVFKDADACEILIRIIKYYQQKYKFEIIAYVIMPSHFHWIVEINPEFGTISDIMRDIKKYSAWDIMEMVEKKVPEYKSDFTNASMIYHDQKRKFWMKRFDDEVIRDEKMLWTKIIYIHNNPLKAELVDRVEDYKYSSARNYINDDHSIIRVNTSLAGFMKR
jgi:REP element-mobilizing transposase RayT